MQSQWGKWFLWLLLLPGSTKCVARSFGHDSVVCECNSTYCDSVGSVTLPPLGQYSSYLSSMAGSRLQAGQGTVQVNSTGTGERDVMGFLNWNISGIQSRHTAALLFFPQESDWLSLPTWSIRRSGGLVEQWQTQQPSTSYLFLLVHKTSCYDSTLLLKVHQWKRKQCRAICRKA